MKTRTKEKVEVSEADEAHAQNGHQPNGVRKSRSSVDSSKEAKRKGSVSAMDTSTTEAATTTKKKRKLEAETEETTNGVSSADHGARKSKKAKQASADSEGADEKMANGDDSDKSAADKPDDKGNPPISSFRVSKSTLEALRAHKITHMFPIQAKTFDIILDGKGTENHAHFVGCSQCVFVWCLVFRCVGSRQNRYRQNAGLRAARGRAPACR